MNVIKLNNVEFPVETYNKNTSFGGETLMSNAFCNIVVTDINTLIALAQETITSIEIEHDGTSIYKLENLHAKINSIDENLSMDKIQVNVNINFNP